MNIEVTVRGHRQVVEVDPSNDGLVIRVDGRAEPVYLDLVAGSECWRVSVHGRSAPVRLHQEAGELFATIGAARVGLAVRRVLPVPPRRSTPSGAAGRHEVRAPMPGLVVSVPVSPGDAVGAGETVAVVEAMKMQMEVPAPAAGRIDEIRARPGQEVAGGQEHVVVHGSSDAPSGEADR
ncbi:MAG: biotin/lipoyl-containing protein [Armatimonadota bacterium]